MAYLPGYTLGCPDKSAELYKRMVKKKCVWLEQFWLAFFPPFKAAALFLHHLFFPSKAAKRLRKMSHLDHAWCLWGTGSCFPFFSAEGHKMLSKKCHILMRAVMFSRNGHWMQYFTKNWARDHFIENTAPSCPNLQFHCRKEMLVTLHYSKVLSGSNQITGKMYKIILKIFEQIL